jgi:SPP1 gp7 family putative phage head morphogenesis protein
MNEVITYQQVRKYDPTHTTALRNSFSRDMRKRFTELAIVVKKSIVDNDCFGLKPKINIFQMLPAPNKAFVYPSSSEKIEAFMVWLKKQVEAGIIQVGEAKQFGTAINSAWMNLYILDSYKRGVQRARDEMRKAGMNVPAIEASGGINAVMNASIFHMDRVGVLFTRTYTDLKGITDAMDMQISRILAQGMIDGDGPALLARKLVATINGTGMGDLGMTDKLGRYIPAMRRAMMLARTEIIRAHHIATIQEYRNWGVLGIKVLGEWKTAGDSRVCEKCFELEGKVFELSDIEALIPFHPQCRCIALPYIEELHN